MDSLGWCIDPFMQGDNYSSNDVWTWTQDHTEVPVFFVCAYLAFVFKMPEMLEGKEPMKMKGLTALWNLALSVFSFAGLFHTVPVLVSALLERGFRHTVCTDPVEWYMDGKSGLWVMLFIYSKIPELMDTVFLVLRKRPVIFLHWFHHCTVLLYCWHAYHNRIAPGLWFAAMNYSVHSVMYAYYFLQTVGWARPLLKKVAPLITTVQILQMLVGCSVIVSSSVYYALDGRDGPEGCYVDPANLKLGLGMYGVYFILFAMLFKKLYLTPKRMSKSGVSERTESDLRTAQGVCDGANDSNHSKRD
eukprot:Hpha_TRINITY_DN15458_c3_g2::TRINITY_DN15458_c3_g2_i4::g.173445::m.173445/K10203/ELOVL6; elongation of very long chain fatty acids protein 6